MGFRQKAVIFHSQVIAFSHKRVNVCIGERLYYKYFKMWETSGP